MCLPVPVLALVATGLSAIGTGVGALSANAQANYRAKVAEQSAGIEREAARTERENTREAALEHYRKIADLKGRQRVGAAGGGVAVDFGTAGDIVADTDALGREDVGRIYKQGAQAVRGHDIGAANYMGEAAAQRQAGTGALIKGAFDFGSTVLGGVKQCASLKPNYSNMKAQQKGL